MAKFDKLEEIVLHDFDGFVRRDEYQMVPVGGRREMGVVTDAQPLLLRTRDAHIAEFANFRTGSGPLPTRGLTVPEQVLPAHSRCIFSIMGVAVGLTEVELVAPDGKVEALLMVSVKERLRRAYNLCLLRDIRRSTRRTAADAVAKMRRVESMFLPQANVELSTSRPPTEVVVPKNLGNPVRIDRNDNLLAIWHATPGEVAAHDAILVYSVWDASDHRRSVGITSGKMCFIDDLQLNDEEAVLTFGHEVGHALGLDHNGRQLLMSGDGNSRSEQLLRFEIDTINPSGTHA